MSKDAELSELHHPNKLDSWEWKMLNHAAIGAVPVPAPVKEREGENNNTTAGAKARGIIRSIPLFPTTIIIATILAVLGYLIESTWLTAIAIFIVLILSLPAHISDRLKAEATRQGNSHGNEAYIMLEIAWGTYFHPRKIALYTREAQRITDVLNECKWMMSHGSTEAEREEAGKQYDEILVALDRPSMFFRGGGIYEGYLSKESTKEAFTSILEAREKRLTMESPQLFNSQGHLVKIRFKGQADGEGPAHELEVNADPHLSLLIDRDTGAIALEDAHGESESGKPFPGNDAHGANESDMASPSLPVEALDLISFYESLAEDEPSVVQLPLAAKRWNELSPIDRRNLTTLMNELSPAVAMVKEADTPGRDRFLTNAREVLGENIAMAERVARGINDSLDRAQLRSMEISGAFIRSAFPDSLSHSLEDEEG